MVSLRFHKPLYRPTFEMVFIRGKSKNQPCHTQGCCRLDVAKISVRDNESLLVISQEEGAVCSG